jgi:hypothetical protein
MRTSQLALYENFVRTILDKVNWSGISGNIPQNREFDWEIENRINLETASRGGIFSEDLIRLYHDKINLKLVSSYQNISENLILDLQNSVGWSWI